MKQKNHLNNKIWENKIEKSKKNIENLNNKKKSKKKLKS